MTRHSILRPALVAVLICGAAQSAPLPAPVKAAMAEIIKMCGPKAGFEQGGVSQKDINGDNRPDYLIDLGRIRCPEQGAGYFCGSAGCGFTLFLSGKAGYRRYEGIGITPALVKGGVKSGGRILRVETGDLIPAR